MSGKFETGLGCTAVGGNSSVARSSRLAAVTRKNGRNKLIIVDYMPTNEIKLPEITISNLRQFGQILQLGILHAGRLWKLYNVVNVS